MARLALIFPLMFWVAWSNSDATPWVEPWSGTAIYLCGLLMIVALMRLRGRLAMRRASLLAPSAVPRFYRSLGLARWGLIAWHAAALFVLGYGDVIVRVLPDTGEHGKYSLPAFVSMLPLLTAWAGLFWTQYPLDRAVREQNALTAFELGEPVRAVPTLGQYMAHAVRTRMLFTLVPLVAIWVLRDAFAWAAGRFLSPGDADSVATFGAVVTVVLLSPELLRRVLPTVPLPPSYLRDRLDALCRRARLRVRDILLWKTHHTLGNAAVMGVLPRVRYVLISDLLLESMTQDQVEGVFAHELGHVVHRHIPWYVLYVLMMTIGLAVIEPLATGWSLHAGLMSEAQAGWVMPAVGVTLSLVLFGMLSRRFERQADFYAARTLTDPGDAMRPPRDGTAIFVSALRQVAWINNMPLDATPFTHGRWLPGRVVGRVSHHLANWLHGSVRSRIDHLYALTQPSAARRFDLTILVVKSLLLVGTSASVAWAVVDWIQAMPRAG